MKMKSMMLLLVAAGFGLVAMLGVMQVLNGKRSDEPMVRVAVAKVDIPAGMPLDDERVGFTDFPQSKVPSGAVTTKDELAGKCLISRAVPGEILMSAKLGGAEAITASHQIPKGMRVATVSVNTTKSHSGLIRPTDRVDVVCTYEVPNPLTRRKSTYVKTVLEFIEVFAVDNMRANREGEVDTTVKNVSLLVDPEQFQLLEAAQGIGELNLSLRNREDTVATNVASLSDKVFFQRDTSEGVREQPSEPEATEAKGSGLQDFLASAMTAMAETTPVSTTVPAETPLWTMTIYSGNEPEDVSVIDETMLPASLTAAERQRMRVEARKDSPTSTSPPPLLPNPPAPPAPPEFMPEPAPAAQPAAGTLPPGETSTAQASTAQASPPAFLPLLPLLD